MKNKEIYINIMEIVKIIDRLYEDEEEMNEGALTESEYNTLMFYLNKILKLSNFIN